MNSIRFRANKVFTFFLGQFDESAASALLADAAATSLPSSRPTAVVEYAAVVKEYRNGTLLPFCANQPPASAQWRGGGVCYCNFISCNLFLNFDWYFRCLIYSESTPGQPPPWRWRLGGVVCHCCCWIRLICSVYFLLSMRASSWINFPFVEQSRVLKTLLFKFWIPRKPRYRDPLPQLSNDAC